MEKEANCVIALGIFEYAKTKGIIVSDLIDNLDPEIDSLDNPIVYLTDSTNWISMTIIVKLFERIRTILQNEQAPYEIAKFAIENNSFGQSRMGFIKSFWSYKKVLKNAQDINDRFNRSKHLELLSSKGNRVILQLHWTPHLHLSKDLCLFNQGAYVYLPRIWGGIPNTLKEKCCFFEGAAYCEYQIRLPLWNRFCELSSRFFTPRSNLTETIKEMEADKSVIEQQYDEVNRLNLELSQKVKQLLAVQSTGKAILSVLDLEQLLTVIMEILGDVCPIHRVIILLVNEEKDCLEYLHEKGFSKRTQKELKNAQIPLSRTKDFFVRVACSENAEYIEDVKMAAQLKENVIPIYGSPTSVYVVPLITKMKVIGVIAMDAKEGEGISKETRETFDIFAPQVAIAIENARLYRKLQEQVLELKQSHTKLSRAEKFSFLANLADKLAYEIQRPMAEIETFIKLLSEKFYDEDFRNDFFQKALKETNRVNNLISELLDLAKVRDPKFEYDNIHGLIEKMILLVSPQTHAKKIEVIRQFDPNITFAWVDSDKLKQAILNILSNAVRFSRKGGKIEILTENYGVSLVDKNSIRIVIRDYGVGIAESQINQIFDPYFTAKSERDNQHRTGLGLFIAQKNIQEHGGSIEVSSKIHEGTTFFINLPFSLNVLESEKISVSER